MKEEKDVDDPISLINKRLDRIQQDLMIQHANSINSKSQSSRMQMSHNASIEKLRLSEGGASKTS